MYDAKDLTLFIKDAHIIKYNGYYMYNVILEKYDYIIANNLIAETLDPKNPISFFFTSGIKKKFF